MLRGRPLLVFTLVAVPFASYLVHTHNKTYAMNLASVRAANAAAGSFSGRRAVVVGATSGIGRAVAVRLAKADFDVVAVGRDAKRGQEVIDEMSTVGKGKYEFVSVDGSLVGNAYKFGAQFGEKNPSLDVLVFTQGIATTQGRTETSEGLDVKMSLHYYSRMGFVDALLPLLRKGTSPKVLSVLSAGVHSAYTNWKEDPELKQHYSLKNAADAAGFYNDIALDSFSRDPANSAITFIHAAPGFVSTSWGTEMPWYIKPVVRGLQIFGRNANDCAEFMVAPILQNSEPGGQKSGLRLIGSNAEVVKTVKEHEGAREEVWAHTQKVLEGVKQKVTSGASA